AGLFGARAGRLPSVTGSLEVDRSKNTTRVEELGFGQFDDSYYATEWFGSVRLSLPVFNGFAMEGRTRSAKGALVDAEAQRRQRVQVNDVVQGDISSTVRAPAKVQPETHVKLSANVPGEVVRIAVKEGDWVRKGQFLLELDGTQYRAQLRQSQAALDAAKSSLRLSEVALEQAESGPKRKAQLFERKLVPPQE